MSDLLSRLDRKLLKIVADSGRLADQLGFRAYLVGGPVRDLLLRRSNADLDIVVEGSGIRLAENFAAKHRGAKLVRYPAFKTATVHLPAGRQVDFATARKETYARGGAFPKVESSDIDDDLLRRDFTVNAMAIAINPASWGQVVDPFGGRKDLRSKKIRVLHEKSFIDDPTRILRAARFKTRLGFIIERGTMKLLKAAVAAKALDTIKPQRYLKECNKILKEEKSRLAIQCLQSWNAWKPRLSPRGKGVAYGTHRKDQ
ncbi:MAG: CCA tRNA nucleotidyltransferase [Candidatus Omnitrophica bacterium]|nr:CCA tRNA nucleotidyltransferase [Candidatus Omnitrophota bacterium]